ncbi:superoxide dismutase [Paenibacillus sp. IB182496]|uniref:superoxide dismutase n=2 Tax=Paenibacillus sabuli TaxID=2772509 RepID=A0A927BYS2_9BACL|nr:superoxide dismutase [Paenibacillus sabuli]
MLLEWEAVFAYASRCAATWREALHETAAHRAGASSGASAREAWADGAETMLGAARAQADAYADQLRELLRTSAALTPDSAPRAAAQRMLRQTERYLACLSPSGAWRAAPGAAVPIGGHTLPPLRYNYNALEPYIDAQTMRIHHDVHHQSYVDGLNKAELALQEARQSGDFALVKHWERELAFNGAGHYLHTLFWNVMSPKGGGEPSGPLAEQLARDFGSAEAFRQQFSAAAEKVEGGGWAILVWSPRSRRLEILQAEKHQNLSQWDAVPLLALDVWEHAYYLKHQNKRAAYIDNWWNVVNWPYVNERYLAARQLQWEPY